MALSDEVIQKKLIEAGIKNLKEFGYPDVNSENILTDIVYAGFFKSMLNDNKGQSTDQVDGVINSLIDKIAQSELLTDTIETVKK